MMMTLTEGILATEALWRLGFFLSFFALLAWLESVWPWRPWHTLRLQRWGRHIGISLFSKLLIRISFPFLLLQTAYLSQTNGQGILPQLHLPGWLTVVLGILALDLFVYLQHRLMHRIKWLWALHQVHHIDTELDVSTGIRFHPFEELLSMGVKLIGVVFWGVPVWGAFLFEILLNFGALFTHTNVRLPKRLEKILRLFIVTPDMHRTHHSDNEQEYTRNFGFFFSGWDRLFNTYQSAPLTGEKRLVFGQERYRAPKYQTLFYMLVTPFRLRQFKPRVKRKQKIEMQIGER